MRPRLCLSCALFGVFLLAVPRLGAQQVTGSVTDQRTGQPLAAVQVFISGAGIGSLSQQNGRYVLVNVPAGTHTLTAERIGYRPVTQQITVAAGETVVQDFALSEEALGLDEIIVTGTPGGTQRRAIGNSVVSVSAADVMETIVTTDVKNVLRARAPGVTLGGIAGNVGQGADITIRGTGSFDRSRSRPLIFVDGVRVNTAQAGPQMAQGQRTSNPLDDFNPSDIESIEIIKGPAAATLYGTEASAGVIQIITKRGREGAPQFNASVSLGTLFTRAPAERLGAMWACTDSFSVPCKEENVVPYYYIHLMNYALRDGTFNPEWNYDNWPQKNLLQYGPSRSFNLDVRGGTERIRYFLSANNDRDEGPVFYNWDAVTRLRGNIGVVFSDQITLDVSSGFVSGETSYSGQVGTRGGLWDQMVWGQGYCAPLVAQTSNPCPRTLGMQQFLPTDQAKITSIREYDRFTGSATLNFRPGDWLSSRLVLGIDKAWDKNEWIHPIETVQANVIQETLSGEILLEKPTDKELSLDWSATVTLPVLSSLSTATSVGAQYYSKTYEMFGSVGRGFTSPLSRTINQTPIARASLSYDYIENKSMGVYVQEQVGWNDRLFLTGAVRFDDNSAFGSDFDFEMYPKVSGTWMVSEESFWNVGLVNQLRVRGAWGQAGRQPNTFDAVNTYRPIAGPGGTSALNPASSGNPAVGPERSSELELGFDVAVLDGRVSGEFSWYTRKNEDNLLGVALPPSVGGGGAIQQNVGRIDNWGWEAALNTRVYESPRFSFSLDLTGTYKMNEIKELGNFPGDNQIKAGWPYPNNRSAQYWVVRAEYDPKGPIVDPWGRRIQAYCDKGVLLDPDPKANARTSQYGVNLGGEVVPCQQVGGYRINAGPAFFPWTWTVSPTISLHQGVLQIRALIDGAYGAIGEDQMKLWHHRYNTAYGSVTQNDPRYTAGYRLERWQSMAYYDKDFWKLREVGVRYQLPESLVRRIGAQRAALSFAGRELAILWAANDGTGINPSQRDLNQPPNTILDPEYGRGIGEGDGGHRADPPATTFHIRFDVTF